MRTTYVHACPCHGLPEDACAQRDRRQLKRAALLFWAVYFAGLAVIGAVVAGAVGCRAPDPAVARAELTALPATLGTEPEPVPMLAAPPVARVQALNTTAHARRDVFTTVLPFSDAQDYRGEPLEALGQTIDAVPFGATWPDGSWRQAIAHIPITLAPNERRTFDVVPTMKTRPAFAWSPGLVTSAPALAFAFRVGGRVGPVGLWEPIESTPLVRCWRARGRIPGTPFLGRLWLEVGSGIDHARLWVQVVDSDSRDPEVSHLAGKVEFLARGGSLVVDHPGHAKIEPQGFGITAAVLDPGSRWGDGESLAFSGRLLFAAGSTDPPTLSAEAEAPLHAVATTWGPSGAFGPWGVVADVAKGWDASKAAAYGRAELLKTPAAWTGSTPWSSPPRGLARIPGSTGDQDDFGAVSCSVEASGWPDAIHALRWSVYREACRPTHLFEVDATPVRMAADYFWGCRPDPRFSLSMYGKARAFNVGTATTPGDGHLYDGRDQEHWSAQRALAWTLLTGDRWAIAEAHHLAELWLAMVKDGNAAHPIGFRTMADAARGEGRPLQAGAMLWLVTGRQEIRDRLRARLDVCVAQWDGRTTNPTRPLAVRAPDGRSLGGQWPTWKPWEEGIGLLGIDAAQQITGHAGARALIVDAGRSLVAFGFWREPANSGPWTIGAAVRWLGTYEPGTGAVTGGAALGPTEIAEGGRASYAPFLPWGGSCLVAVKREALAVDDSATALACQPILDQLATMAQSDPRVAEWIAVR